MAHRLFRPCGFFSPIVVGLFLPGTAAAQLPPPNIGPPDPPNLATSYGGGTVLGRHGNVEFGAVAGPVGSAFGPGYWHSGWPYGPRVAPGWGYPGLYGGPFVGYPFFSPYSGRAGCFWSNGLSLYGPPVPTYGPIPGVFGNNDLGRQWSAVPSPGFAYGWFGLYAASPRPRPLTVNVWPVIEGVGRTSGSSPLAAAPPPPGAPLTPRPGGCLILSVKVPQPAAEVFVDGVKTTQLGKDRLFESPVLEAGKEFQYELTARWVEGGVVREEKRVVTGTPGEVVRVDFTVPQPIVRK